MNIRIETEFSAATHGAALLELMTQYARDLTGMADPLSERVKSSVAEEIENRPNIRVAIAYVGDEPAGFTVIIDSYSTFACKPILNIHDIFVAKKFRSGGIATALLAEVETVARKEGCCKLTLEVLENNTPALNLYHRAGFSAHTQDPALGRGLFFDKHLD